MTAAEEHFRAGQLGPCLDTLQGEVRRNPADPKARVFLAQLLMIMGRWERAATQLSVLAEMDAQALPMVHAYRAAMQCERVRAAVFAGEKSPLIFGEPEPWVALLIQSLSLLAQGRTQDGADLRAQAFEAAPATAGTLNGVEFDWIADADSRLGPVLEVLLNGAYYWVPFHRIAHIGIDAPEDVRDLVWLPARFTWSNGGESMGLIPTRYPGSEAAEADALRLARRTEWSSIGADAYAGTGQRVLASSSAELSLLDVREITLRPAA